MMLTPQAPQRPPASPACGPRGTTAPPARAAAPRVAPRAAVTQASARAGSGSKPKVQWMDAAAAFRGGGATGSRNAEGREFAQISAGIAAEAPSPLPLALPPPVAPQPAHASSAAPDRWSSSKPPWGSASFRSGTNPF